jgi:hypothetical protein
MHGEATPTRKIAVNGLSTMACNGLTRLKRRPLYVIHLT